MSRPFAACVLFLNDPNYPNDSNDPNDSNASNDPTAYRALNFLSSSAVS